jgi:hypothetical protein
VLPNVTVRRMRGLVEVRLLVDAFLLADGP